GGRVPPSAGMCARRPSEYYGQGARLMRIKTLLLAGTLLPLPALAQDLSYTFIEAAYIDSKIDVGPFDVDGDGRGLRGSVLITDSVFLIGEYSSFDYSRGIDATGYALGAGMRWNLKPELDLVGDISWVHEEVELPGLPDADDDGFAV